MSFTHLGWNWRGRLEEKGGGRRGDEEWEGERGREGRRRKRRGESERMRERETERARAEASLEATGEVPFV